MRGDANRKSPLDAAESKTLRMRGNSLHGNRETLETPLSKKGEGRSAMPTIPYSGAASVASHSTEAKSERARVDLGTYATFDAAMASQSPDPTSLPRRAL